MGVIGRQPTPAPLVSSDINDGIITEPKIASTTRDILVSGRKNLVINGDFDIWQRGTVFNSHDGNSFFADRWGHFRNGSGATINISLQGFSVGQTTVPNGPTYFARVEQTVAGTGATFNVLATRLENLRHYSGQTVTLSFWAKTVGGCASFNANYIRGYGAGGSTIDGNVVVAAGPLNTSWTKYTTTFVVPNIVGKTLGTGHYLQIEFALGNDVVQDCDIAQVQLELGDTATEFERRSTGEELALCQRYYETGRMYSKMYLQNVTANALDVNGESMSFKVEKRVAPTCTSSQAHTTIVIGGDTRMLSISYDQVFSTALDTNWTAEAEL